VAGELVAPFDTDYGLREGSHVDPDGNVIRFGSPITVPSDADGGQSLISADDPVAAAATSAVQAGDHDVLRRLLGEHPELVVARIGSEGQSRTLVHAATDWPGHYPRVADTVALLAAAGADVDARFVGSHAETPLHWAASSDDVDAIYALLAAGADIEAPGAVLGGGRRWPTRSGSASGTPPAAWWRQAQRRAFRTPPRSGSWTVSTRSSGPTRHRRGRRLPTRCGPRRTPGNWRRPATSSSAAPI
jgi:hypothetical protein